MAHGLLKGKRGIISGALNEQSIAWKVAELAHAEGATIVLTNAPVAMRMGEIDKLAEAVKAPIIGADATKDEDLERLFAEGQQKLGGKVDFLLHSIGMSPNVRKGKAYEDLNYDWFKQTLDISAMSLHRMVQAAFKQDAMAEWGSIVALSYIAAQRVFPGYGDMADAKALLESIARSWGYYYGQKNKVRVNTVSQSPTPTTAGSGIKGFGGFYGFAQEMSPLGNAPAVDCANYCITLFSDLSRYVTMQNLFHDGGFSSSGVTMQVMEKFMTE
ncbi:MAG: enoyl-ACP reductase [Bacteroidetes bacterium]|jgi:enoyl-[acyl-carrier protein] reductase I|nr:enoyl-ACP reductase [Bacteroidota bacterium]MBX7129572.1 enoyl-ACP reductase [Flavobacteriales bacterium]MCC6656282.1 enoyl-ACP reductase [Flavobacteriales bacterium]HMU13649.1 enoyl-ACP reductase [Flavobacteriales bacterium]HMW97297.1 enoyl-ACP reductase [Flavobacteriales bacterium]